MRLIAKIKWIASILLVFFIVLITNLIDRDHYRQLNDAVNSMYDNKVVASNILIEMSLILKEKEIAYLTSDTNYFKSQSSDNYAEIKRLSEKYASTNLIEKEQATFDKLQVELEQLQQKENSIVNLTNGQVMKGLENIEKHLYELSEIQLQKAKRQVMISDRAKDTLDFFAQSEIIFLVIMAVLVQIIILYKPKSTQ